jgi:hypothetical protein
MKFHTKMALGAILLGAAMASVMPPADAGVSVSIGVGPRPAVWYGPPGPCGHFRYRYGAPWRNCGFPVSHAPIFVDGRWYHGPFYYREFHGRRWYWIRGDWRRDEWHGGWRGKAQWGDDDRTDGNR